MKMLTTQLTGLFQRIAANEEESVEETARLLAQAAVGEGVIYFAAFGEMKAVALNAIESAEPFQRAKLWTPGTEVKKSDRVWILTRHADHVDALALAQQLFDEFIPFAALATERADEEGNRLSDLAYTYIALRISKGLLPNEMGERVVLPHALAALYVYEAVKLSFDEMASE